MVSTSTARASSPRPCTWLVPGATTTLAPFLLLFGATYFFAEFGPNTTTFVYPAEIFPVPGTDHQPRFRRRGRQDRCLHRHLRAHCAAAGHRARKVSALVAVVSILGLVVTVTLLPEPRGASLEQLTEIPFPDSAMPLAAAESRGTQPPVRLTQARPRPEPKRSLEVRWILPGQLETAVAEWFARFPAGVESREDTYLTDPQLGGLSVKLRQGRALEVKAYQGSPGVLQVAGRACGRLESWDKWSFPCDPVGQQDADQPGWYPVRKLIRRFSAASGQSGARLQGRGEEPRCAVELTEIRAGGQAWWTVGFEATGPASLLRTELETAAALVFDQALPGGVELGTEDSKSYAQWLTGGRVPSSIDA